MLENTSSPPSHPSFPQTVAVVGLGLIGGSLALRLRQVGARVVGVDIDGRVVTAAQARGAIDVGGDHLEAAGDADLVIVATPLDRVADVALAAARTLRPGAMLTDVGSVKTRIVAAIEAGLPEGVRYVGGHPMAGTEGQGLDAADPALLDGRPFVLTPTSRTAPAAVTMMQAVIARIGMRPVVLDPVQHDELVAQVSHLPYLASLALLRAAAADAQIISGPAFADMTRVARSPATLWAAVCRENRAAILRALASYEIELGRLRRALESGRVDEALPAASTAAPVAGRGKTS